CIGAPVPSITFTLRITRRSYGPSPASRAGICARESGAAAAGAMASANAQHRKRTRRIKLTSDGDGKWNRRRRGVRGGGGGGSRGNEGRGPRAAPRPGQNFRRTPTK